ncbi:type III-A CRISPR-associated RAMP protein Csm4 [Bacillota bacterium]
MKYSVFKLDFKTPIHIGADNGSSTLSSGEAGIHADTIFSALCHEALLHGGQAALENFKELFASGHCLISDAFPYLGEELYLPRPFLALKRSDAGEHTPLDSRKKMKDVKYIAASKYPQYIDSLVGKGIYEHDDVSFGTKEVRALAAVNVDIGKDSEPYHVGTFLFDDENCAKGGHAGLYIILAWEREDDFEYIYKLMGLLGLSGIGGKRSSGFGKFELDDPIFIEDGFTEGQEVLYQMLSRKEADYFINLSVAAPPADRPDRFDESSYQLLRRGGFVQSENYSDSPLKKKVSYFFAPGSCFKEPFAGEIKDVSINGRHPVYRYGIPLFMGVSI